MARLLTFVLDLPRDYGLDDFYLELSTRNPEKSVGDEQTWEDAIRVLAEVAEASRSGPAPDPGGAAFYGPKISAAGQGRHRPDLAAVDHSAGLLRASSCSS